MSYDVEYDVPVRVLPTTLSVKNFGPIVEADVELRPLTVFVGPSDTGKSYLSVLIYALHNLFSSPGPYLAPYSLRDPYSRQILNPDPITLDLTEQVIEFASGWWLNAEFGYQEPEAPGMSPGEQSMEVVKLIGSMLAKDSWFARTIFTEIGRCFDIEEEISRLIRRGANSAMSIRLSARERKHAQKSLQFEATATSNPPENNDQMTASIPASAKISITRELHDNILDAIEDATGFSSTKLSNTDINIATEIVEQLLPAVFQQIGGPLGQRAYYLPADRGGLMHVHREVLGALISDRHTALPGPLRDFIRDLATIPADSKHQRKRGNHALADRLERDVLDGRIKVERSESGYPSFLHRPMGWMEDIALTRASSKISELAPLSLYLRHYISTDETIIIDEPESHLHPEAQAKIAIFIARLVCAGYKIIIATHSDWILEQFANLVRMSELTGTEREHLTGADAALLPDQFGAWRFRHDGAMGGTIVEEIDIEPEKGGLVRDYRQILDETYNTWAEIGNRIADRTSDD